MIPKIVPSDCTGPFGLCCYIVTGSGACSTCTCDSPWGVGGSSTTTGIHSGLVQNLHQDQQDMCLLSLTIAGTRQESPVNASQKGLGAAKSKNKSQPSIWEGI